MNVPRLMTVACVCGVMLPRSFGQDEGKGSMNPYASIEKKATLATPDDPTSIETLADEILRFPRSYPSLPDAVNSVIKQRLVRSELLYRQRKRPGVKEDAIVSTLNGLGERFGAPLHSRTTVSQVRVLRMWLALSEPGFMGAGVVRPGAVPGEPIGATLGPPQAIHLIDILINQKLTNPDFQVAPKEWEETSRRKVMDQIEASRAQLAAAKENPPSSPTAKMQLRTYPSDKRRALESSFIDGISRLTTGQAVELANQSLISLGID